MALRYQPDSELQQCGSAALRIAAHEQSRAEDSMQGYSLSLLTRVQPLVRGSCPPAKATCRRGRFAKPLPLVELLPTAR